MHEFQNPKTLHFFRNRVELMRVGSCALAHMSSGLESLKLSIKGGLLSPGEWQRAMTRKIKL